MGKRSRREAQKRLSAMQLGAPKQSVTGPQPILMESLLDEVHDGNEYQSIVSRIPRKGLDLIEDVIRGIAEIEKIRDRPCLAYVGNVVKKDDSGNSSVDLSDDLPFREMVAKVPA